jgi:hypothetical protein
VSHDFGIFSERGNDLAQRPLLVGPGLTRKHWKDPLIYRGIDFGAQLLRVQREIPCLKYLCFDGPCANRKQVIVPADKQRVIVDLIVEALKQFAVFALKTAARLCMFECIPVLVLQLANFADIKIRKRQQRVRAKRLLACFAGQIFRDLTAGTCEGMDGDRIAVVKKQRQRGAECRRAISVLSSFIGHLKRLAG